MVTTVLDEECNQEDKLLGYKFAPDKDTMTENKAWFDGIKVNVSVCSGDFKSRCTFPNFFWSFKTISDKLRECGFASVNKLPTLNGVPIVVITARREK